MSEETKPTPKRTRFIQTRLQRVLIRWLPLLCVFNAATTESTLLGIWNLALSAFWIWFIEFDKDNER